MNQAPEDVRAPVDSPRKTLLTVAAISLLVLACTAPTLGFGFLAWDNPDYVTNNPLVVAPETTSTREQLTTPRLGYAIPITVLSYRLDRAIFGLKPLAFHATNVLLHLLVCWLGFRLARRLGLSLPAASLAVLWFGLHPAAAEPVSWATGRKDLLGAVFGLGALEFSLGAGFRSRTASVACYALGLLSKPVIAPIVLLVPILRACRAPLAFQSMRKGVRREALRLLPYLCVLAPIAAFHVWGQHASGTLSEGGFAGVSRPRAAWYAFGHHASLALLSEEPTAKYAPQPWPPHVPSRADFAALALLTLLALAIWKLRDGERRTAVFGAAFAGLMYLPSSSLLLPLARYLADTYIYLPLLGIGLVLGAALDGARALSSGAIGRLLSALPWAVGVLLGVSFVLSSARFHDDLSLWTQAHRRFPHHQRVCRQWSNAVVQLVGPDAGLLAIDQCIAEFGDTLFAKNRGITLLRLGRLSEARVAFLRAQQNAPQDPVIALYLNDIEAAQGARTPGPAP